MQKTIVSPSTTTAKQSKATVVQHDTAAPGSVPSIKLHQLGVSAQVKATKAAKAKPATPQSKLVTMEQARIGWETTELAASNKRLYSILKDAYSYYLTMKNDLDKDVRKKYREDLQEFIKSRNYKTLSSSHDMSSVVKCVFGVDRRRVSAYSLALREALRQEVTADELPKFIEDNGGVEQIRLGGTKPMSVAARAEEAKVEVLNSELGMFKFDPTVFAADSDWRDKQVVIVATYMSSGEFQANAVIQHDGVVTAALAAYYNNQQAQSRAASKAERDAEKNLEKALKATSPRIQ